MQVEPAKNIIRPEKKSLDLVHSTIFGLYTTSFSEAKYYKVTFLCNAS